MSARRVVVSGLGVVSPLGITVEDFWDALREGRSGIRPITSIASGSLRFSNGAEVQGFDSGRHFDDKQLTMIDRAAQFAVVAARAALADAGLVFGRGSRQTVAVVTGCSAGGQGTMDEGFVDLYRKNLPRVNPLMIPRVMANSAASQIAMEFGLAGPSFNISTACSSSNHAIGQAFWMVRNGVTNQAVAGGCEAVFSYGFLKAWEAMRVVAPDTCRPFSRDRKGLILGEGAGMLVLETLESALSRGARIHAEIVGFGMSTDAHHITQPLAEGAAAAMTAALSDGGFSAESVGYINAHGTGTGANDQVETTAIRLAFGAHADRLAVSSTKSMHGHALGAAGALEAVATVLTLERGFLPPTANYTEPDPECNLDVVPNIGRAAMPEAALSNSFAFGGLNAVLAFRRYSG